MRFVFVSTVAFALVAQDALAAAPNMKPGMWEITAKMEMPSMPGGMAPQVVKQCLTQKDTENPQKVAQGGQNCQISNYRQNGDTVSWDMACQGTEEMTGSGTITFAGETYTGTTRMSMKAGGQTHTMTMLYSGKRVGDCK